MVTTEELASDPEAALARCWRHAGVEPISFTPEDRRNVTEYLRFPRLTAVLEGRKVVRQDRRDLPARAVRGVRVGLQRWPAVGRAAAGAGRRVGRLTRPAATMSAADRRWVADVYQSEIAELRRQWDRDFAEWSQDFPLDG